MSPRPGSSAVLDNGGHDRGGLDPAGEELVLLAGPGAPAWLGRWLSDADRPVVRQARERGTALLSRLGLLAGKAVLVARSAEASRTGPAAPDRPVRVAAALRDLPDDAPVLAEAVLAARQLDGELLLVHAVPLSFGERSVGLDQALEHGVRLLADAAELVDAVGAVRPATLLSRVRPHELVGEDLDADLVVLGGARPGGTHGLGLVAGSAVHHAPCPVLLIPRAGRS